MEVQVDAFEVGDVVSEPRIGTGKIDEIDHNRYIKVLFPSGHQWFDKIGRYPGDDRPTLQHGPIEANPFKRRLTRWTGEEKTEPAAGDDVKNLTSLQRRMLDLWPVEQWDSITEPEFKAAFMAADGDGRLALYEMLPIKNDEHLYWQNHSRGFVSGLGSINLEPYDQWEHSLVTREQAEAYRDIKAKADGVSELNIHALDKFKQELANLTARVQALEMQNYKSTQTPVPGTGFVFGPQHIGKPVRYEDGKRGVIVAIDETECWLGQLIIKWDDERDVSVYTLDGRFYNSGQVVFPLDEPTAPAPQWTPGEPKIGDICWFWDDDKSLAVIGRLSGVDHNLGRNIMKDDFSFLWFNCEQVYPAIFPYLLAAVRERLGLTEEP